MNLKNLFMINAVVALFFGVVMVLFPAQTLDQYGLILIPASGILMARFFGGALLGIGVISWLVKDAGASEARDAAVLGFIVADVAGFIVALMAQMEGTTNALGWTTVALYLLLGLGFAYFKFMKN